MELGTEQSGYVANCKDEKKKKTLHKRRVVYTPNDPWYQFVQGRGLAVLETEIGMVAILPVSMALVSSVFLTAEEGVTLRKGEELGYFQVGGSDIVVMFEAKSKVELDAKAGTHYKMGAPIGSAQVRSQFVWERVSFKAAEGASILDSQRCWNWCNIIGHGSLLGVSQASPHPCHAC